jgi:hypothetical protein
MQWSTSISDALDAIWALIDRDVSGGIDEEEYTTMHGHAFERTSKDIFTSNF